MSTQAIYAFGPEQHKVLLEDWERATPDNLACKWYPTPDSQNQRACLANAHGCKVVLSEIQADRVTTVEFMDVRFFGEKGHPTFNEILGWLMPERVGQNLCLESRLAEKVAMLKSMPEGNQTETCNWLPGPDASLGKVVLQLVNADGRVEMRCSFVPVKKSEAPVSGQDHDAELQVQGYVREQP